MREKKKLKIPKKITKHKIQKYCKDPVEDMYITIFKMPRGDSIQCISLNFFCFAATYLMPRGDSYYVGLSFCTFFYALKVQNSCYFFVCTMSANLEYIYVGLLGPKWKIIF